MNFKLIFTLLLYPLIGEGIIDVFLGVLSAGVFKDGTSAWFYYPGLSIITLSVILIGLLNTKIDRITIQESLLFVCLCWSIIALTGCFPFIAINHLSFTDAVFESLSGLTTTGATVLTQLDNMPKTLLLYRQILQWVGGLGMIILVVAIMPILQIGGMKLYKAETPGPMKDDKIAPRLHKTTRILWVVYLAITLACALCLHFAGMNWFDAIAHALSTVSTGGFSTHDASIGYYHSTSIELIVDLFMLIGAISFSLHFRVFKSRNIASYWRDEETRWFILINLIFIILLTIYLKAHHVYETPLLALRAALFQEISFITSTGFASDNFTDWPVFCATLLIMVGFIGGCTGSTAGGNKVLRTLLIMKINYREIKQLIHPRGVFCIRYNGRSVENKILDAVVGFLFLSIVTTVILVLILMLNGLDLWSAFTSVATCLNVLGPAFGVLSNNFIPLDDFSTWTLTIAMLVGRLEYFTVILLFIPGLWRKHANI